MAYPAEVQAIADNTDFVGYVVIDFDGIFGKTIDVTKAVAWALERSRVKDLEEYVKVYRVFTWGKYSKIAGQRAIEEHDWNKSMRELMR